MADGAKQIGMMTDEQGKKSFSRWWFSLWLTNAIAMMWYDLLTTTAKLSGVHQAIVGAGVILLGAMAGGPRIAQYFGPKIGEVVKSLASIRRDPRNPDHYGDDESDE